MIDVPTWLGALVLLTVAYFVNRICSPKVKP